MDKEYTSIEAQVEYGLDTISEDRTVTVSLRDLLYVHQVMGELNRFFHNNRHYPTLEALSKFIGNKDAGAYHLIWECYYHKLRDVWPEDVEQGFTDSCYDNPIPPYYYEADDLA